MNEWQVGQATHMDHFIIIFLIALAGIGIGVGVAWYRMPADDGVPAQPPREAEASRTPPNTDSVPEVTALTLHAPAVTEDSMDWLAQAADELRTPLTVLRGQVEFLRQHIDEASRHALLTVADRLIHQVDNLEGLVEAWTATAEQTDDQRPTIARPTDLHALTRNLCARLTKIDEPPFDLAAGPALWALVDQPTLEHAIGVLLRNARRASPFGLVEVVARTLGEGSSLRICLSVADRRAKVRSRGTDLWEELELDLVRVLVEDLGGWLELEDRGGGGAITSLWLPSRLLIPMTGTLTNPRLKRSA